MILLARSVKRFSFLIWFFISGFFLTGENVFGEDPDPLEELREEREERKEAVKEAEEALKKRETYFSDAEIESRVRDALIFAPEVFDAFLTVSVDNSVVLLGGRALSEGELNLAIAAAYRVEGVLEVRSSAEVRPLTEEDAEELKRLRSKKSPVEPFVPTYKTLPRKPGVVDTGPSPAEKTAERMRAYQQRQAEDRRIKKDVEFAIRMAVDLTRVQAVYVSVYDGTVTLSGVVADNLVRSRVYRAALNVRGVRYVVNSIRVR